MLIVRKATAFITRDTTHGREVLIFRHPLAGIQLPAGTVEAGETVEQGVLREVLEETGLSSVHIVEHLGVIELKYDGILRRVVKDVPLLETPAGAATDCLMERGILVNLNEERGKYASVTHRDDLDPYFTHPAITGWVLSEAVQPHQVVRHLFHLQTTEPTPDTWEHFAEDTYQFRFYWVSVNDRPTLAGAQQSWWDYVIDRLRT
ncbi:MAG: NUDIX domain-containing protein [Anaerolineae bacterium]